jgi:hypothetical protein
MYGILKTIGIDFLSHEYIQIIQECFNSIHFENEHSNEEETETGLIYDNAESAVEELLLLHQQRLMTRRNLPDEYDFTAFNTDMTHNSEIFCNFNGRYSFFELINHWIRLKPLNPIKIMKEMAQHRGRYI